MFISTIHHIAINASNYAKTKEFYIDKLGFTLVRENIRKSKNDIKLDLQSENYELEIFISSNHPKRPSYPEALGLRHIAFKVTSVETTSRLLQEKAIECEPIRIDDFTGKKMTFFFDPDGLPLEIHE